VTREEVGLVPRACNDLVIAVLREGQTTLFTEPTGIKLRRTDRLVVVRGAADRSGRALTPTEPAS
jgi:hypothetical protein